MRLVIEREGGFSIVEDADAITEIDVRSDAVVLTIEVGGDKWTKELPVADHAEACRVSAAIAVKCGVLVEELAEPPMTQERVDALYRESLSNGLEDAEDDDAMGAVMAGRIRKPASEWVDGLPPKGREWWVVDFGGDPVCVRWNAQLDGLKGEYERTVYENATPRYLPTPIPER